MDIPPLEGELPQNEEFYWSLTEDGDVFDFNTPITSDITLYPISKSKRVNVDFYYRDGVKIASKLCKTGSKISASDLGFNSDIFTVQLFDKTTGEEFKSSLSYVAEGYSFKAEIQSGLLYVSPEGAVYGTEDLRAKKKSYTLSIPRYLNGIKVETIGNDAFSSKDGEKAYSFTSLILPDSLGFIGEKAFMNCKSLVEVSVPRGVSFLSNYIFAYCSSLKSFTFQNEVTTIGKGAFIGCTSLSEITFSENIKSIGEEAFKDCSNLSSVALSNKLDTIGDSAFASCIKLPTITIPNSVSYIGIDAFYDCRIMKEIIIDKNYEESLPGAVPWGGYEIDYNGLGRDTKDFVFKVINPKGEVFFTYNPKQ